MSHPEASLNDLLINHYITGCPVCGEDKCKCEPRSGRPKELLDEVKLEELKASISLLAKSYPEYSEVFSSIDDSFDVAIKTADEGLKKQAIVSSKKKLSGVFTKTGKTAGNANQVFKLLENLSDIVDKLPL